VPPLIEQPFDERAPDARRGEADVAPDGHARLTPLAHPLAEGAAYRPHDVVGQVGVRDAADVVFAKDGGVHAGSFRRR
jgi:hypothetical protein